MMREPRRVSRGEMLFIDLLSLIIVVTRLWCVSGPNRSVSCGRLSCEPDHTCAKQHLPGVQIDSLQLAALPETEKVVNRRR